MRVRGLAIVAAFGVAFAGTVAADEIVYFTNGTAMPIRSHKVENGMIRVDLGNDSAMAFPLSMVEKVENAGRNVFQNPSFGPANQAVGPVGTSGGGSAAAPAATGYATLPSRNRARSAAGGREPANSEDQLALGGPANPAPPEPSAGPTAAVRRMRAMGRMTTGPGEDGTLQRGGRIVIGSRNPQTGAPTPKPIVGFGPRTTEPAETPEPAPEADEPVEGNDDPGDPDNAQVPPE
jgi:hypothetical protein